jgi:DNA-binding beta-propeller fold protein YncE
VPVQDPYNLYFTPDGRFAIVVAERLQRLDFRDPHTMKLRHVLPVPCQGVNHMDFSLNGRYAVVSCEFSGILLQVDVARRQIVDTLALRRGSMPQDVKLSPRRPAVLCGRHGLGRRLAGGSQQAGGRRVPPHRRRRPRPVCQPRCALSVMCPTAARVRSRWCPRPARWRGPGGCLAAAAPNGWSLGRRRTVLWLSGRYHDEVYAINTHSGRLLARIPVGRGPHGLCVYPQPGRYSLGHTGVFR